MALTLDLPLRHRFVPATDPAHRPLLLSGAEVAHRVLPAGRGLSQADVAATSAWLKGHAR